MRNLKATNNPILIPISTDIGIILSDIFSRYQSFQIKAGVIILEVVIDIFVIIRQISKPNSITHPSILYDQYFSKDSSNDKE